MKVLDHSIPCINNILLWFLVFLIICINGYIDEMFCLIPDGQGFTRERKTRLLELEEERKQPQSAPSSRQMTTAEFAVVCLLS